jgi:uncharacterized protein (DUF4415 family)
MSKPAPKRVITLPSVAEDRKIRRAANADPDAQPLTRTQLAEMVPIAAVRGRPRSEAPKQLVSIRYSAEVLSYFRSTGPGWQSRMDGVLLQYVARQDRQRRQKTDA